MKTKQLFITLLALLVSISSSAYDAKIDGIYYKLISKAKQAEVIAGDKKYTGSVVIPKSVEYNGITYSVITIGESAFDGCSGLTSVTIPNSVTTIGNIAFWGCSGLTSITIPNSVKTISEGAFRYCESLKSVTIPNSVTTIGGYAFYYCTGLTSITIPNSVTTIDNYAFSECI